MADLHELARMLKELDDQMVTCMRCGMCQAVCPVYAETGREADVARGKIAMLGGLAEEILKDPEQVKARLDKCLLCGSCAANCPSGVKALDIFLKGRAILTGYLGLSPAKKLIFKGMLSNPRLFNRVLEIGAKFQGLFVKEVDWLIGSSCARFQAPVVGDRHFKALADVPFHKKFPSMDTPRGPGGKKAAVFVGCVIDKVFPSIGEATLKALSHSGAGVFMPANQACCGIPALASGDLDTFKQLVRMNVAAYEKGDFDQLITSCATCASTMKKIWPLMADTPGVFDAGEAAKVKALAEKVMDVSQYLVDELGVKAKAAPEGQTGANTLVTFHDPCHLKKSLHVSAQPRELVKANPNCALVEMNESDWCCGCGGSFNLQEYDTSRRIGMRKRDNIVASKAWVLATACPACMLQITDMLSQAGDKIQVKHAVELYAETLP